MMNNREYVASLERIVHASKFNLVKADNSIKEMTKKQQKLQDALKIMKDENKSLNRKLEFEKEKYVCNVCWQNPKDCIIDPCRHFAGCKSCCCQLDICPICRTEIKSYITLFIS